MAQRYASNTKKPSLLRSPGPVLQRKCACGNSAANGECEECKAKKALLQRKPAAEPVHTEVPTLVHDVLRAPGKALDERTRRFFEPRFGYDFSRVRVHTDAQAAQSSRAVNALAYTAGSNVVFASGHYTPDTPQGKKLLAHELAHVVQQSGSVASATPAPKTISDSADVAEVEADRAAADVMQGRRAQVDGSSAAIGNALGAQIPATTLQRQETAEEAPEAMSTGGCRTITSTPCPGKQGQYTMLGITGKMYLVNKGDCWLFVAAHDKSGAIVGTAGVPIAPGNSLNFDPPKEAADVSFACTTNCDGTGRLEHPYLCA